MRTTLPFIHPFATQRAVPIVAGWAGGMTGPALP